MICPSCHKEITAKQVDYHIYPSNHIKCCQIEMEYYNDTKMIWFVSVQINNMSIYINVNDNWVLSTSGKIIALPIEFQPWEFNDNAFQQALDLAQRISKLAAFS